MLDALGGYLTHEWRNFGVSCHRVGGDNLRRLRAPHEHGDILMTTTTRISSTLIRKLREDRAWSQEHLASCTGLSLRTIQRVESDGTASYETRLALAGAFGLAADQLMPDSGTAAPPKDSTRSLGQILGTTFGTVGALAGLTYAWIAALSSGFPTGSDAGITTC